MNDRFRDHISDLIALLHQALRTEEPRALASTMATVRAKFAEAESLTSTPSRRVQSSEGVPGVFATDSEPRLVDTLERHLSQAREVRLATAFLSADDANPLILPLRLVTERGGRVQILTSLMGFFNRPDALRAFRDLAESVELRIYADDPGDQDLLLSEQAPAFHAKALLVDKDDGSNLLAMGSANFTAAGLGSNIEWNYLSDFEVNAPIQGTSPYSRAVALFDRAWSEHGFSPTDDFLNRYEEIYRARSLLLRQLRRGMAHSSPAGDGAGQARIAEVTPRPAQSEALAKLSHLRDQGVRRFAVIAATGIGKTYLSAFEVRNAGARRVLFLAHRESILRGARRAFRGVMPDCLMPPTIQGKESIAVLNMPEYQDRLVAFAMVQTIGRKQNLDGIDPSFFDYVIVDEFHHAEAATYRTILRHLKPTYLLGMTATPERMDGQDVLEICDRRVAYEVRLRDAVERGWLARFHYYAIHDPTDYEPIRWTGTGYDEAQLEEALSSDTRADLICHNLRLYQPAYGKRKCLAFCSNVGHAKWMAGAFERRGFPARVIWADTAGDEREEILGELHDEEGDLEIVCSVDVLNEGIDVPSLTHVLMLRPTQSFTVFLQQLGRGLRLFPGKRFVTVLDFVGNFKKSYVAPLALAGDVAPPSKSLRRAPELQLPKGCYVQADTEVQRVWDEEIRTVFSPASRLERLRLALEEIAGGDDIAGVALTDLFLLDDVQAHVDTIQSERGWLRVREKFSVLTEDESRLLDTPAEQFLLHIESGLNSVRSYKMAVLHSLLSLAAQETHVGFEWPLQDLARHYLAYYLEERVRMSDWDALADFARRAEPADFPLFRVVTELKRNPLKYLSNSDDKHFVLTDAAFALKEPIRPYWADPRFRDQVKERVDFAEARYWYRKRKRADD